MGRNRLGKIQMEARLLPRNIAQQPIVDIGQMLPDRVLVWNLRSPPVAPPFDEPLAHRARQLGPYRTLTGVPGSLAAHVIPVRPEVRLDQRCEVLAPYGTLRLSGLGVSRTSSGTSAVSDMVPSELLATAALATGRSSEQITET